MKSHPTKISKKGMTLEQWREERRNGIGGSDSAGVLGLSPVDKDGKPYKSALDIYRNKTEPGAIGFTGNEKTKAGTMLESVIGQMFSEKYNLKIRKDNFIRVHPEADFIRVNLDFVIVGDSRGPGVLEVKNTTRYNYDHWASGSLPINYYCQIQHEMLVTGYRWAMMAVLVEGWEIVPIPIEADDDIHEKMIKVYGDFWNKNVLARVPPPPQTAAEVEKVFPISNPRKVILAADVTATAVFKMILAQDMAARWKKIAEEYEFQIKTAMGDAEKMMHKNRTVLSWKNDADGLLFKKNEFAEDHPDLYKKYTEVKPGRRRFLTKVTVGDFMALKPKLIKEIEGEHKNEQADRPETDGVPSQG